MDNHKHDSASLEDKISSFVLKKNVYNYDRDGKGICCWSSINDDRAEDGVNDNGVGERGATAADDVDDGVNGKEERVDNNGGGDNWGDVSVDNYGSGVASLVLCLPPIIVKSDGDRNRGGGGGADGGVGGAGLLPGIDKKR